MAPATGHLGMFPGQLERHFAVIEGVAVRIDPIVASQAVTSICLEVGLQEIGLDLLMAGNTDALVKCCITIDMAGAACKRRTVRLPLVGGQGIPESIV
jgi:hypothetical protein